MKGCFWLPFGSYSRPYMKIWFVFPLNDNIESVLLGPARDSSKAPPMLLVPPPSPTGLFRTFIGPDYSGLSRFMENTASAFRMGGMIKDSNSSRGVGDLDFV